MKINIRLAIDANTATPEDRRAVLDKLEVLKTLKIIDDVEMKPNGAIVAKAEISVGRD